MNVTVFGGGTCSDAVGAMAEELGRLLVQAGHTVVTGGYGGVMSWVSKGAREAGGDVIGVVIKGVSEPNMFISEVMVMDTYWQRLGALMEMGDAYIALPGGSGTSVELLAALHTQKAREKLMPGSPHKPVILLSADETDFDRTLGWLHEAAGEAVAGLLLLAHTPELAVSHLTAV